MGEVVTTGIITATLFTVNCAPMIGRSKTSAVRADFSVSAVMVSSLCFTVVGNFSRARYGSATTCTVALLVSRALLCSHLCRSRALAEQFTASSS